VRRPSVFEPHLLPVKLVRTDCVADALLAGGCAVAAKWKVILRKPTLLEPFQQSADMSRVPFPAAACGRDTAVVEFHRDAIPRWTDLRGRYRSPKWRRWNECRSLALAPFPEAIVANVYAHQNVAESPTANCGEGAGSSAGLRRGVSISALPALSRGIGLVSRDPG
jgi:hypothetical protein